MTAAHTHTPFLGQCSPSPASTFIYIKLLMHSKFSLILTILCYFNIYRNENPVLVFYFALPIYRHIVSKWHNKFSFPFIFFCLFLFIFFFLFILFNLIFEIWLKGQDILFFHTDIYNIIKT